MNTHQARHAMLDGKRVGARGDQEPDRWWFYDRDAERIMHHVEGHVDSYAQPMAETHDYYIVEDKPEPKFRECEITSRTDDEDIWLAYDIDPTYSPPLYEAMGHPDFAGILMPDGKTVEQALPVYEKPSRPGEYYEVAERDELEDGSVVVVDLAKCKVLLRRRDEHDKD